MLRGPIAVWGLHDSKSFALHELSTQEFCPSSALRAFAAEKNFAATFFKPGGFVETILESDI
jgi:hypothetical protein